MLNRITLSAKIGYTTRRAGQRIVVDIVGINDRVVGTHSKSGVTEEVLQRQLPAIDPRTGSIRLCRDSEHGSRILSGDTRDRTLESTVRIRTSNNNPVRFRIVFENILTNRRQVARAARRSVRIGEPWSLSRVRQIKRSALYDRL